MAILPSSIGIVLNHVQSPMMETRINQPLLLGWHSVLSLELKQLSSLKVA